MKVPDKDRLPMRVAAQPDPSPAAVKRISDFRRSVRLDGCLDTTIGRDRVRYERVRRTQKWNPPREARREHRLLRLAEQVARRPRNYFSESSALDALLMRSMILDVENPFSRSIETTSPSFNSTTCRPTICPTGQSPPLTRTSGTSS